MSIYFFGSKQGRPGLVFRGPAPASVLGAALAISAFALLELRRDQVIGPRRSLLGEVGQASDILVAPKRHGHPGKPECDEYIATRYRLLTAA